MECTYSWDNGPEWDLLNSWLAGEEGREVGVLVGNDDAQALKSSIVLLYIGDLLALLCHNEAT